ncbi:hypothetical protein DK762_02370 [Salmonella enterica subsp. houtenae]|nr:hypothetical protein [Salmonella enterica subsp. houtenae]ECI3705704.1 hypothetical protein [Salmonella enterica subsp. houtenae]MLR86773.1 hypothetical protein [Salmonella enterica subsp. houtenae]
MTAITRRKPTIMGSFLLLFPFLVSETVIFALQNKNHTVMNPIIWVVFTLLALDTIREVMGVSSLTGLW